VLDVNIHGHDGGMPRALDIRAFCQKS